MTCDTEQLGLVEDLQAKIDQLIDDIPLDRLDEATREELRKMLKGQVSGKIREASKKQAATLPAEQVVASKEATAESSLAEVVEASAETPEEALSDELPTEQVVAPNAEAPAQPRELHLLTVENIQRAIEELHGINKWDRPGEWKGELKRVTTFEERLQKLKDRGISIDLEEEHALKILKDKGYHVLKRYAKPFVDKEKTEMIGDGKDYYKEGTSFSLVHALYYVDHEIRGVLFDAIGHIETNLRNNLDYHCSKCRHHLWYLDVDVVRYERDGRGYAFTMDNATLEAMARLVRKREKERGVRFKTEEDIPYAHEALSVMHLGGLLALYRALMNEEDQKQIAQVYGLHTAARCSAMLMVLKDLRNAVAHYDCLFRNEVYGQWRITKGPLFSVDRESCTLADAILMLQYFLSKISLGSGRLYAMSDHLRCIFEHNTGLYLELKKVFQDYYAYEIYMAKTLGELEQVALKYGYQHIDLQRMGLGSA